MRAKYARRKQKYFSATKGVFSVRFTKEQGTGYVMSLYRAASTAIRRHVKIIGAANPYDPNYSKYFEKRRRSGWHLRHGEADAPASYPQPQTRIVSHWLQFAAACPHRGAPVEEA